MFDLSRIIDSGLVARIDFHESIGSTSDRALELGARGETQLPLLVLAQQQTAGRGRGVNRWWSADGALTFSLVLDAPPDPLPPSRWPQVALAAGVAVCQALETLTNSADLRLKWPNDVFLAGRKLCGILSESIPGWRDRLVIGIGINVNNRIECGPRSKVQSPKSDSTNDLGPWTSDLGLPLAISLLDHDNIPRDLTDVLLAVLDEFDRRWQELLENRFAIVAADYQPRCFLTDKTVTIEQPGNQTLIGFCHGIDEQGHLRIQTDGGEVAIASGTIAHWEELPV